MPHRSRRESFLFPDLRSAADRLEDAPARLDEAQQREWASRDYDRDLQARFDEIGTKVRPGAALDASFEDGELRFFIDGIAVLDRIFVDQEDGEFILAQWKIVASTFSITERTDGKALCAALRRLAVTDNPALKQQIIALERELRDLEEAIAQQEREMNDLVYRLYELTPEEIEMVEREAIPVSAPRARGKAAAVAT